MMKEIMKCRQRLKCCQGMTLVEIMVAMVIVSIIAGIVWNVSLTQMRSAEEGGSVLQSEGSPTAGLELLKRDLAWAGYGTLADSDNPKSAAFFIQDGGATGSDKIYLHDGVFIDSEELGYDINNIVGQSEFTGAGTSSVTLDSSVNPNPLDLDLNYTSYGLPPTGNPLYSDGDSNEFKGGIWQYVITDTLVPTKKVAKIDSITGFTLNLDKVVDGSFVSPAIYYCVDYDGSDSDCHPAGEDPEVLRRSSRSFGNRQAIAANIVDMQIAYKVGTRWYCDGVGTCSMNPFYAGQVDLIRITLVARSSGPETDPAISVENGPSWGNDGFSYRTFSVSIRPRNNIEL